MSKSKITKQEYGFDYLRLIPTNENAGLKQLPAGAFRQAIDTLYLPKYFNQQEASNYPSILNEYLANYAYSTLALTKQGVIFPKDMFTSSDYVNWSNLLQILLLFIENNASKLTENTAFTYTENNAPNANFKFDINKNIGSDTPLSLLKSLDRAQKQLVTKGLSIQDQIKTNQSIFVEYNDESQTDQNNPDAAILIENLKRTDSGDYFLNYVNNAVENGNKNKNKNLNGLLNLDLSNQNNLPSDLENYTIPIISLLQYDEGNTNILGYPEFGTNYSEYYGKVDGPTGGVWSTETKKLFLDQYANFFFDFINSVKIEYLSGFDTYDYFGILDDSQKSPIDEFNNFDLSSNVWKQLTNTILDNLNKGEVILCKMVDFMPAPFKNINIPLVEKLKFYRKYYNYFLIIKGQKDLQIKAFGSTINNSLQEGIGEML